MSKFILQPEAEICGDSPEDTELLKRMAINARHYIASFDWCPPIKRLSLAYGIGGVVAVFLAEYDEKVAGTDDALWLVEGDLPSAYMVVDGIEHPKEVIETYCSLMDDWIDAVNSGKALEKTFPISVEPTVQNALALAGRVCFLREKIIPLMA